MKKNKFHIYYLRQNLVLRCFLWIHLVQTILMKRTLYFNIMYCVYSHPFEFTQFILRVCV